MRKWLVLSIALCLCGSGLNATAAPNPVSTAARPPVHAAIDASLRARIASGTATPAEISASIDRQGAYAFVASLDSDESDWLVTQIGTGKNAWVELAPRLALGSDASVSTGLIIALARALPRNPAAVLKAVDPEEGDSHILAISRVCGLPFLEGTTPKGYREKALHAVSTATRANPQIRARCLKALHGRQRGKRDPGMPR